MEPFSILCTTCQTRLRVRDESAVGQILACPKCGSMVLIETPAGSTESVASSEDKSQPTLTPEKTPQKTPSTKTPAAHSEAPSASDKTANPQVSSTKTNPTKTPAAKLPAHRSPADKSPAKGIPASAVEPTDASGPTRPTRKFKFREDFETPVEAADAKTRRKPLTPAPPKQAAKSRAAADRPVGEKPTTEDPATEETPLAETSTAETQIPLEAAVSPAARHYPQWLLIGGAALIGIVLALLVVGILSSRRGGNNSTPKSRVKTPPENAPLTASKEQVKKEDAKQGAGDGGTAESSASDSQAAPAGDTAATPAKKDAQSAGEHGPDSKGEPSELEGTAGDGTASTDGKMGEDAKLPPDLVDPTDVEATHPSEMATKPDGSTVPSPSPPAADAAKVAQARTESLLSMTVPALSYERIALADFAKFISDMTTIPITLDVDALYAIGVTPETELEFDLRGVTIRQILDAALEPLEVNVVVAGGQVIITPRAAIRKELTSETYDVSDLAEDDAATRKLAGQITSLIAPSSWNESSGEGDLEIAERSIEVQQTRLVQYQIARFLDRLRTARGLLPRSDLPANLLETSPPFVQVAGKLNEPIAATFPKPTPVAHTLDSIQTQTDLRILVDWQALAAFDIQPATMMSVALAVQPFYKLLDNWLAPSKLDYRLIDMRTIQISTQAAIRERPELELYRIENDPDLDHAKLIDELKKRIGEPFFTTDGGLGTILYDESSRCLLVSLPQPQQRILAAWLRINRKSHLGRGLHRKPPSAGSK